MYMVYGMRVFVSGDDAKSNTVKSAELIALKPDKIRGIYFWTNFC